MSLLTDGLAFLAETLAEHAKPAGAVSYQRKSGGSAIDLTGKCWVGRTPFKRHALDGGPALVWGDRDYLIPVAHLGFEPERGDRITETIGESAVVFEVWAPKGEKDFRYSDAGRTILRVHAQEQAVA